MSEEKEPISHAPPEDHDHALEADTAGHRPRRRAEPLLLEVAWEACNQVGGIYTVLRSKAPTMVRRWGQRYCLVGPYNDKTAPVEFEPLPLNGVFGRAVKLLREWGVQAEYGRWLVTGRPHLILLHLPSVQDRLNDVKYRLWADHQIPTPTNDALVNDVVAFGEATRQLMHALAKEEAHRRSIVAHVHEWMAGACIPMLRHDQWPGSFVFTTHATILGRYLAMHNPVFYDHLPFFNTTEEARHFNIECQHRLERAAAHGSHVFTTVSDVTGHECEHLLGRKPDAILPNGINPARFEAVHDFQAYHNTYKQRIHDFVIGHFFPSYTFDLDRTLYMFTSGRYEYRNKGMDLTLEALARLNHRLKQAETPITIVFFLVTKAPFKSINVQALQSSAMLADFRKVTDQFKEQIGSNLFYAATAGKLPDLNDLVDDYWRLRLRRNQQAWKRNNLPLIVTHDLVDDGKDAVLAQLRNCNLLNHESDRVKIVYHPDFMNATSPLLGLDYDQFVRGCHLGIFPSYYEPWGYTPLESIALGVPAVTSDLSGFGSYLNKVVPDIGHKGLFVVPRRHNDPADSTQQLTDYLFDFCQLSRRQRIELRNHVESFAQLFDWTQLSRRYDEAHDTALDRVG